MATIHFFHVFYRDGWALEDDWSLCSTPSIIPGGTVAIWRLLPNKGHLTACLESAKWHLQGSNSTGSKHSLVFWDKNVITWSESGALQLAKTGSMYSILNVKPVVRWYIGNRMQGLIRMLRKEFKWNIKFLTKRPFKIHHTWWAI